MKLKCVESKVICSHYISYYTSIHSTVWLWHTHTLCSMGHSLGRKHRSLSWAKWMFDVFLEFILQFCLCMYIRVLDQRASYLVLRSFSLGQIVQLIMIISSLTSLTCLLIDSKCLPNGTHINHCGPNLAHTSTHNKNIDDVINYLGFKVEISNYQWDSFMLR